MGPISLLESSSWGLTSRPLATARMQLLGAVSSLRPSLWSLSFSFSRPGSHSRKPVAGCAAPQGRASGHSRVQPLVGEGSQNALLQQKSRDEMPPARGHRARRGPEGIPSPGGCPAAGPGQRQPGSKGNLCLAEACQRQGETVGRG